MDLAQLSTVLADIPFTAPERGKVMYDFIRQEQPRSVLELGFAHGVSSCYIGAALRSNGSGHLTTIDLDPTRQKPELRAMLQPTHYDPDIESLLKSVELQEWVQPIRTPTSYTWELMRMIEETPEGEWKFDFAFIDGAHSWFVDGFAFLLVDRLLKPGGWILFDDLDWTFGSSPTLRGTDLVKSMPVEERDTPQIGKVFDLLVRRHPGYGDFRVDGSWGWAHKSPMSN
jgi:predicted O-methyltransferase YrrM